MTKVTIFTYAQYNDTRRLRSMYTMSNEYDKILRDNFKELKTNLLSQLVTAKIVIARSLVPNMQQTVIERETDTVAEIETVEGKRFIVHIEWQSSNDPRMASRMAMYDLMLNQTYGMEVMGAVLYLGNDPLRMNREHSFLDFRRSRFRTRRRSCIGRKRSSASSRQFASTTSSSTIGRARPSSRSSCFRPRTTSGRRSTFACWSRILLAVPASGLSISRAADLMDSPASRAA